MATRDADLRLDGNAAAGWLAELFCIEMTAAEVSCAGCGLVGPIGELIQYGHDMGVILRCPACDTAVVRIARGRGRYWLDLRGSASVRITSHSP